MHLLPRCWGYLVTFNLAEDVFLMFRLLHTILRMKCFVDTCSAADLEFVLETGFLRCFSHVFSPFFGTL